MNEIEFVERPAAGEAEGLLVLHHGRGSNEHDLIGLADIFDPEQRLHVVSPQGPLTVAGWPGRHWYISQQVGFPEPVSFLETCDRLAQFHQQTQARTGIAPERTVLGGFSMGAVMSFATGLGPGRAAQAGILALSGFIPTVDGWHPDWAGHLNTNVLVAHGQSDPMISFQFALSAREQVAAAGLNLTSLDSMEAHNIAPEHLEPIREWLASTLSQ